MAPSLSRSETRQIRSRLAAALCNLQVCELFWIPTRRTIAARSVDCRRHFKVPADALELGRYSHPFATQLILDDLAELLDRLAATPAPAAPGGACCAFATEATLPHAAHASTR